MSGICNPSHVAVKPFRFELKGTDAKMRKPGCHAQGLNHHPWALDLPPPHCSHMIIQLFSTKRSAVQTLKKWDDETPDVHLILIWRLLHLKVSLFTVLLHETKLAQTLHIQAFWHYHVMQLLRLRVPLLHQTRYGGHQIEQGGSMPAACREWTVTWISLATWFRLG